MEISADKDAFEKRLERACLNDYGKIVQETERMASLDL